MAEYIVTVNKGVDWQQLHTELTTDTSGSSIANIPDRAVTVIKLRPTNNRTTHYDLTVAEADTLKNDDRVMSVEPAGLGFIVTSKIQDGNFSKTANADGEQQNWGLLRHTSATNIYSDTTDDPGGTYNYVLDGTGVDVVIMDSGIQADHPEFQDANGVSRVKQIDWFAESGVSGTMPDNHYTDRSGHGTHVASTVAGKTFGWAKNADIYVQTIIENKDRELSIADAFDTLLGWHNAKTNGRPTVVNMSWGYVLYANINVSPNTLIDANEHPYAYLTGGSYRGVSHTDVERNDLLSKGATGRAIGSGLYQVPYIVSSVDVDVEQLTDSGIIVCIAAGNHSIKQDVSGGADYDNYVTHQGSSFNSNFVGGNDSSLFLTVQDTTEIRQGYIISGTGFTSGQTVEEVLNGTDLRISAVPDSQPSGQLTFTTPYTGSFYYNRGSSPRLGSNPGFNVGAIGNQSPSTTQDGKAEYSDGGPAVNIYAAGTNIIGACSNTTTTIFAGIRRVYYLNTSFWQMNITGTSMASPQVAGMAACLLQAHPTWTPTQVVNWFQNNATDRIFTTGNSDDYTDTNSLWGSEQRLAYFKLSGSKPFQYIAS